MRTRLRKTGLAAAVAALAAGATGAPPSAQACGEDPVLGEACLIAFPFCPQGYVQAAGQLLDVNQNTSLFALIGTTFGGDGRHTFALPDLRGRVPVHVGQQPGQPDYRVGQRGGSPTIVLNAFQLPAHTHAIGSLPIDLTATLNGTDQQADSTSPAGALLATPRSATYHSPVGAGLTAPMAGNAIAVSGSTGSGTSGSVGASAPIDNRQPFLALRYCIAVQGVYPPRS